MRIEPLAASSRALLRALNLLPAAWAEESLALGALAQGLLRPSRRRRAHRWAASQPAARDPWQLTRALLAERGRFLAAATQVGVRDPEHLRRRLVVEGRERLDAAARLRWGPPRRPPPGLGRHRARPQGRGLPHRVLPDAAAARSGAARPRDGSCRRRKISSSGPTSRAASSPSGGSSAACSRGASCTWPPTGTDRTPSRSGCRERDLAVRGGWLAVRRTPNVTALPVLAHTESGRLHVRIHPPFPEPLADREAEIAACRAHLAPIVGEFVRRWPAQCFMLALGRADGAAAPPLDGSPTGRAGRTAANTSS